MRVAFISWRDLANHQAGGSEVFIDRLATGLLRSGHQAMHLCGGPVAPRPYPVVETGGTYSQYLRAPFVHHRVARHWDLLVDTENGIPFFSPLWRRGPILTTLYHVHTDQWGQHFPASVAAAGRFVESRIMPRVYRGVPFLTISDSTVDALEGLGVARSRVHLLRTGVDPPTVAGVTRDPEPTFVCLGRLVPHKRVDLLLRAWERVRPTTGGRLLIVGDGPQRQELTALAGEGVTFTGKVDDDEKWRLLGRAWVLLHPAQHEGWGIAIIEAAAMGTPAIGFRAPGVQDAIEDGETGLLVRSEEELARAWVALAADPALRQRLSAGAVAHAATFGWDEVTAKFVAIAEEVVAQGRRRTA